MSKEKGHIFHSYIPTKYTRPNQFTVPYSYSESLQLEKSQEGVCYSPTLSLSQALSHGNSTPILTLSRYYKWQFPAAVNTLTRFLPDARLRSSLTGK
jgi:hypothetical protein